MNEPTNPTAKPSPPTLLQDLELVNRQMLCVIFFAGEVQRLFADLQKTLPTVAALPCGHHLVKMNGERANAFMQWVGDFLNGMDAVTDDHQRWDKVMTEAHERWKGILAELNNSPA